MTSEGSVTQWLRQIKAGDHSGTPRIMDRYFEAMVRNASRYMSPNLIRDADKEDVAQSAFASLWHGATKGKFPELRNRDDFWRLLVAITAHKAADLRRSQNRLKRGGGNVVNASAIAKSEEADDNISPLSGIAGPDLAPEFVAQAKDELQHLLDVLKDPELEKVVLWRLEGYTTSEIAEMLDGRSVRTVERYLRDIRHHWQKEFGE